MTERIRLAEVIDCFFEAERCAGRCLRNFLDSPRQRHDLLRALNGLMMCHHQFVHCLQPLLRGAPRDWATVQLAQHLVQRGALLEEAGLALMRELGHDGVIADTSAPTWRSTGAYRRRRTSRERRRQTRRSTGTFQRTATRRRTTDTYTHRSRRRSTTEGFSRRTTSATTDSLSRSTSRRRPTERSETTTTGSAQLKRTRRRH